MELTRRRNMRVIPQMGGIRDIGGMFADMLRSGIDIAGKAVNVAATRGGADSVITMTDDSGQSEPTNPMVWYGLGAAGILVVAAIAAKKRKRK